MSNRTLTTTMKIAKEATGLNGNLYVHADHDEQGFIMQVYFSSPGKFDNTQLETILEEAGKALTTLINPTAGE